MIALEKLADGSVAARNFDKLAALVLDTGGQTAGIRFGTATLTWAAGAALSDTPTVMHGLGSTPAQVFALINGTGGPDLVVVQAFSADADSFQIQGGFRTSTWAGGGTLPCAWTAIG